MRVPFTHGLPIITFVFASTRLGNFTFRFYHSPLRASRVGREEHQARLDLEQAP